MTTGDVAASHDFSMPAEDEEQARSLLRNGTTYCVLGFWQYVGSLVLFATSSEEQFPQRILLSAFFLAWGAILFQRGEKERWIGQLSLSHLLAHRRALGLEPPDPGQLPSQPLDEHPSRSSRRELISGGARSAATAAAYGTGRGLYLAATGEWPKWWFLIAPVGLLGAILHSAKGNAILRRGKGHFSKVISSPQELVPGSYVLYLRSFDDDYRLSRPQRFPGVTASVRAWCSIGRSEEERLDAALRWAGPVVTVGVPEERVPPFGALRMSLPRHDWEEAVVEMMRRARLVVIGLGAGRSLQWEFGEAIRLLPPERLLLLVPMGDDEYGSFRATVEPQLREHLANLPDDPADQWLLTRIQGAIHYTPDGKPVFTRLRRPPIPEDHLIGSLDRALRPFVAQLTRYELR